MRDLRYHKNPANQNQNLYGVYAVQKQLHRHCHFYIKGASYNLDDFRMFVEYRLHYTSAQIGVTCHFDWVIDVFKKLDMRKFVCVGMGTGLTVNRAEVHNCFNSYMKTH